MTEKFSYKRSENSFVLKWETSISKQTLTTKGLNNVDIDKLGTLVGHIVDSLIMTFQKVVINDGCVDWFVHDKYFMTNIS